MMEARKGDQAIVGCLVRVVDHRPPLLSGGRFAARSTDT